MSNAPERIWIDDERSIGGELTVFIDEPSCLDIDVYNDLYNTKYIRADRIEELEAKLAEVAKERDEWQSLAEAAITDDAAKNIHYAEIQAKLTIAMVGLVQSRDELDLYSQNEYPSDHPVHERYRKRDYDANPARIAIAKIKGEQY